MFVLMFVVVNLFLSLGIKGLCLIIHFDLLFVLSIKQRSVCSSD